MFSFVLHLESSRKGRSLTIHISARFPGDDKFNERASYVRLPAITLYQPATTCDDEAHLDLLDFGFRHALRRA